MLRLAHRILTQKSVDRFLEHCAPAMNDANRTGVVMAQTVLTLGCPVIIADNVCDYVLSKFDWPNNLEDRSIGDFPPCPPAFQHCFIEHNYPEPLTHNAGIPLQGGTMVYAHCINDADKESRQILEEARQQLPNAHWLLAAWVFYTDKGGTARLLSYSEYILDKAGTAAGHRNLMLLNGYEDSDQEPNEIPIFLHALAFMQCKNVARIDATAEQGPSPKWCRRQRVPELKYHALRIDPNLAAKQRTEERKTEGDRSGKALHICRGHFAHFTDDGASQGLFGRRQFGTFWIPAHTRGSLEHGRVISTYNVKSPA